MMHYLSVHDIVWINSTITGKSLPFDYEKLEAAMAAQYSYGDSTNVPVQSANLLSTLVHSPSFAYGNQRTAFIAVTTFLNANGYALQVDDSQAADLIRDVASKQLTPAEGIASLAAPADITLRPGVTLRALVSYIFNEHTEAIKSLAQGDE